MSDKTVVNRSTQDCTVAAWCECNLLDSNSWQQANKLGCVNSLKVVLKSISNKIAIYHTHQDRVEHWYEEHCEYRSPDIDPGDYNKNHTFITLFIH